MNDLVEVRPHHVVRMHVGLRWRSSGTAPHDELILRRQADLSLMAAATDFVIFTFVPLVVFVVEFLIWSTVGLVAFVVLSIVRGWSVSVHPTETHAMKAKPEAMLSFRERSLGRAVAMARRDAVPLEVAQTVLGRRLTGL